MSLDHRFVFADNIVLRCKCQKDEYFPMEILDFEDILGRLKTLFCTRVELRRNSDSSPKRELSLKERLFVFDSNKANEDDEIAKLRHTTNLLDANVKNTDSVVLQVSPMMRHRRKNKNDKMINPNSKYIGTTQVDGLSKRNDKCRDIIECLSDSSPDFVHVATFSDISMAEEFLRHLRDSAKVKTIAIDIYVTKDLSISVSFQRLIDFKQDFMMLDLKRSDFMLFLKPF